MRSKAGLACLVGLALRPLPVLAQEQAAPATPAAAGPALPQTAEPEKDDEQDKKGKKDKRDLLVIPVPLSNPRTGTGLALGAIMFWNPNHGPQTWVTGGGIAYTDKGTKAIAAMHSMSLADDRFRVRLLGYYADQKVNFFGVGPEAGDRNQPIDVREKVGQILMQGQIRVAPSTFVGGRFLYLNNRQSPLITDPNDPDQQIPLFELHSKLSSVGPSFQYDSKDESFYPRRGLYVSASWLFGTKLFGGDFKRNKLTASTGIYTPLGNKTVLAGRFALCGTSSYKPLYDLCFYGSGVDLRGYEGGRYRDRATWALQGEVRQELWGRFGAVAFAGIGGIAPSLGDVFSQSKFLPAAGIGLRYKAVKSEHVNLRIDFAVGRDAQAVYVGIGEAF